MNKKIDWSILDKAEQSLNEIIVSAAPAYSSLDKLKKAICTHMSKDEEVRELLKSGKSFNKKISEIILKKRHDLITLDVVLIAWDCVYRGHARNNFKNALLDKFEDSDIDARFLTTESTRDYFKDTVPVGVLLSFFENSLLFKQGLKPREVDMKILNLADQYIFNQNPKTLP